MDSYRYCQLIYIYIVSSPPLGYRDGIHILAVPLRHPSPRHRFP